MFVCGGGQVGAGSCASGSSPVLALLLKAPVVATPMTTDPISLAGHSPASACRPRPDHQTSRADCCPPHAVRIGGARRSSTSNHSHAAGSPPKAHGSAHRSLVQPPTLLANAVCAVAARPAPRPRPSRTASPRRQRTTKQRRANQRRRTRGRSRARAQRTTTRGRRRRGQRSSELGVASEGGVR